MQPAEHNVGYLSGLGGTLDPNLVKGFSTPEECAYTAGFFDGEGHCNNRASKAPNGKVYISLHVTIGQKNRAPLEWLQKFWGGNIYLYEAKQFSQWSITGTRARKFLSQIRPYTIVKCNQIDQAVIAWEGRNVK